MNPPFDPDSIDWTHRDENGNEITDPQMIIQVQQDIVRFGLVFARYIKENDPLLWRRAADFASDYTEGKAVKFIRHEDNTHGTE